MNRRRKEAIHNRDANEDAIVEALRARGAKVYVGGPLDLIVGYHNEATGDRACIIMEIKDGRRPPSERRLSEFQEKFIAEFAVHTAVVLDEHEALDVVFGRFLHRQPRRGGGGEWAW